MKMSCCYHPSPSRLESGNPSVPDQGNVSSGQPDQIFNGPRGDNHTLQGNIINFLQDIYRFFSPLPDTKYPVIFTPFIYALLFAVYYVDLTQSGILCSNFRQICTEVYLSSEWGGLYFPQIKEDGSYGWTLLTHALHHSGIWHLLMNVLSSCYFLTYFEVKYGTTRTTLLALVSALGGGLFACWWYPQGVVVGFSGVVFSLLASILGETFLNRETISSFIWPALVGLTLVLNLIFEFVFFTHVGTWGHIGGALAGFFFSLIIFPNFVFEKWEPVLPVVSLIGIVLIFGLLPLLLFLL